MPTTKIVVYQEREQLVPLLDWFDNSKIHNALSRRKCLLAIERLRVMGHELRRPEADYLEDGIYELRVSCQHQNFRILYGFVGKNAVLLTHGIVKERRVPPQEINLALIRMRQYEHNPMEHTYQGDNTND